MPSRHVHATRRLLTAGSSLALLTSLLLTGPGAHAAAGGTFEMKGKCNPDGSASTHVTLVEHFTGLDPLASYHVFASRTVDGTTYNIDDGSTYWEPAADGSRDFTGDGDTGHLAETVQVGDSYHWMLHKVGSPTNELEGDVAVDGLPCEGPPPPPGGKAPDKASFAHSPSMIRVGAHGSFHYRFDAAKALHGRIAVARKGTTVAHATFVVPPSGVERPALKLGTKALHKLRQLGHATYGVTVTLTNPYGSSTAHHPLVLKKPT